MIKSHPNSLRKPSDINYINVKSNINFTVIRAMLYISMHFIQKTEVPCLFLLLCFYRFQFSRNNTEGLNQKNVFKFSTKVNDEIPRWPSLT